MFCEWVCEFFFFADPSTKVNDGDDTSEAQSAISLKGVEGACSEAEKKPHGTTVKVKNNIGGRRTAGQQVSLFFFLI